MIVPVCIPILISQNRAAVLTGSSLMARIYFCISSAARTTSTGLVLFLSGIPPTHIGITNSLDLFDAVFLGNGIKVKKETVEFIDQNFRIHFLGYSGKPLDIRE